MISSRPPQLYGSWVLAAACTAPISVQEPGRTRTIAGTRGRNRGGPGLRLIVMTAFPHMKSRAVTPRRPAATIVPARPAGRARRRAAAITLAGLTLAALAACNTAGSTGSSPGASAPPIVTTPAPRSGTPGSPSGGSGCPKDLVVPSTDNSRTFCVAVGGTVTITATPDQAQGWLPFDNSGTALTPATSTPESTGSAKVLAAFTAASPGTSTISASHRNCPSPAPGSVSCNSIALWKVTITVK
jgi:hypothetical protein